MKIEHIEYYSHVLNRQIKVEIIGHFGYPIITFPTSNGNYTQNTDFGLFDTVSDLINDGKIKFYNIETIDSESFYGKHLSPQQRIKNYEKYVQFIAFEFIPHLQKIHQTHRVAIAGCSFGGYHAANVAFKYPDLISHLFSLSGAFTIRNFMENYQDSLIYFNSPEEFVPYDEAWRYQHMRIVLSTSDEDICLDKVRNMSKILQQKGIDYWYDEAKWIKHDWPLWRMVFPKFINHFFK